MGARVSGSRARYRAEGVLRDFQVSNRHVAANGLRLHLAGCFHVYVQLVGEVRKAKPRWRVSEVRKAGSGFKRLPKKSSTNPHRCLSRGAVSRALLTRLVSFVARVFSWVVFVCFNSTAPRRRQLFDTIFYTSAARNQHTVCIFTCTLH